MPAEPPVIRIVRLLSFITVLSDYEKHLNSAHWNFSDSADSIPEPSDPGGAISDYVDNPIDAKKLEALQKMISNTSQQLLPVGRFGKNTGDGYGARHRAIDKQQVLLSLPCRCSRHNIDPLLH